MMVNECKPPPSTSAAGGAKLSVPGGDGRLTEVAIALPVSPPPSNYIPLQPRVLEAKLARRLSDDDAENLRLLNKRIGLRCSLRYRFSCTLQELLRIV
jgi:hypothetical protein